MGTQGPIGRALYLFAEQPGSRLLQRLLASFGGKANQLEKCDPVRSVFRASGRGDWAAGDIADQRRAGAQALDHAVRNGSRHVVWCLRSTMLDHAPQPESEVGRWRTLPFGVGEIEMGMGVDEARKDCDVPHVQ